MGVIVATTLLVVLSGCADSPVGLGRSWAARDFIGWVAAQPGVVSVDLHHDSPGGTPPRDGIDGSIWFAEGTDVPASLEAMRLEFLTALPDAFDMDVTVGGGIPFGFAVQLTEQGPGAERTAAAIQVATSVREQTTELQTWLLGSGEVRLVLRAGGPAAGASLDTMTAIRPLLDLDDVNAMVVGGDEALPMPTLAVGGRSVVDVTPSAEVDACMPGAVAATRAFLDAEPTAMINARFARECGTVLTVPVAPAETVEDVVERAAPAATAWVSAMRALPGGGDPDTNARVQVVSEPTPVVIAE